MVFKWLNCLLILNKVKQIVFLGLQRKKMESLLAGGTTLVVDRYSSSGIAYSMAKVGFC